MFLKIEMSQLFVPGSLITSFGALPKSPRAGRRKTDVSNQRLTVREPRSRIGLPTTTTRAPSPPPVMSALSTVEKLMPLGVPLAKAVMPDNCQLSKTDLTKPLSHSRLARGRSHV